MCMDFRNLNKACPKDPFPTPKIDQLVDATVGHPRISFLDAFQGYHQIPLALDDQEKMAFVTPIGNYHYKVMPFGLKNAGSTYQWMMTKMFEPPLGRNLEVYIDDMVVKSKVVSEHVKDLRNTEKAQATSECFKVLFWCRLGKVFEVHGDSQRH